MNRSQAQRDREAAAELRLLTLREKQFLVWWMVTRRGDLPPRREFWLVRADGGGKVRL